MMPCSEPTRYDARHTLRKMWCVLVLFGANRPQGTGGGGKSLKLGVTMLRIARRLVSFAAALGLALSVSPVRVMSAECLAARRDGKCPVCDVASAASRVLPPCCRAAHERTYTGHASPSPSRTCKCVLRVGETGVFALTPTVRTDSGAFPAIVPDTVVAVAVGRVGIRTRSDASDSGPPRAPLRSSAAPRAPPAFPN